MTNLRHYPSEERRRRNVSRWDETRDQSRVPWQQLNQPTKAQLREQLREAVRNTQGKVSR